MIWMDFIVYMIGFLLVLGMTIVNRREGGIVFFILSFFAASGLLYIMMDAAYSVEEKFNPNLHDCIQWKTCISNKEKYCGVPNYVSNSEYWDIKLNYTSGLSSVLRGFSECVSWQPKQQEKKYECDKLGV